VIYRVLERQKVVEVLHIRHGARKKFQAADFEGSAGAVRDRPRLHLAYISKKLRKAGANSPPHVVKVGFVKIMSLKSVKKATGCGSSMRASPGCVL
jgi:hypothetical protein